MANMFVSDLIQIGSFVFIAFANSKTRFLGKDALSKKRAGYLFAFGSLAGIFFISLTAAVLLMSGIGELAAVQNRNWFAIAYSILHYVAVSLAEESICRGLVYNMFLKKTSRIWAVALSSVVFSLMHLANPGFNLLAFINITLIGIAFCCMAIKSGGSLMCPIGFHFTWNLFQGNFWGMSVSGTTTSANTNSILALAMDSSMPSHMSGGIFGPEASVAATLVVVVCILFFYYRFNPKGVPGNE
ncbi:MAG: CPBP family intramembrane metalloprotease [Eubacteriaceae bacterium]|nr:CPBP family intramembrane metalloprotease [Eubacteriaceae bacterium]